MSHPSLQDRVVPLDNAVHHGGLRADVDVTTLLLHASEGSESAQGTIEYLNTTGEKTASYNYVIDRPGTIYRMARPNIIAYHAGDSAWPNPVRATPANPERPNGGRSINRVAIGICWANNARNTGEGLTPEQLESGLWLCATLARQHPIAHVLGHYEVSPGRKVDPLPAISMDTFRQLLTAYQVAA
jgi:N-acetylmuramoyl-L-alanine amidase